MSILIAYATKYGCAEKCAKLVSEEIGGRVDLVNLKNSKDVDLSKYEKVIIGGSIYIGKIQKEVTKFCSDNLEQLKKKQIGLFICGMQEEDIINTELNQNFPAELLEIAQAKEYLGGEFIFNKMNFVEKMVVKKVSKVTSDKSNILEHNIKKFANVMNSI